MQSNEIYKCQQTNLNIKGKIKLILRGKALYLPKSGLKVIKFMYIHVHIGAGA